MYIRCDRGRLQLREAQDFKKLSLIARQDDSGLKDALGGVGELLDDGSAAWLDVAWFREQGSAHGEEWQASLASMIEKAARYGWVSDDGKRVRAHVDYRPEPSRSRFGKGAAIVIGGTGAIGAQIVRQLTGEEGVDVAFTYRAQSTRLEKLQDEIGQHGASSLAIAADIGDSDQIDAAFAQALEAYGHIQSVIFAAGIPVPQVYVRGMSREQWRNAVDYEVNAFFDVAQNALSVLKENGGSLVALTSVAIRRYPPRDGLSGGPKAAVESLVRAIAREEGRFGIRANCVEPGLLEAGIGQQIIDADYTPAVLESIRMATPTRRFVTEREVADCVVFLASDHARSITGHAIPVDGGFHV